MCIASADAFAGKPAPTGGLWCFHESAHTTIPVGAGLPAKGPARHVSPVPAPSLASQLLQGGSGVSTNPPTPPFPSEPACRRRGRQDMHRPFRRLRWQASSYRGLVVFPRICPHHHSRRSRLAGEGARKTCIARAGAFAGKPAPTGGQRCFHESAHTTIPVGAGLPAKRPARHASPVSAPSLASQFLQGASWWALPGVHWRTFPMGCRICTGWCSVWPWL
jgi:hypothetical protein